VLAAPATARADGIDLSWFGSSLGGSPEHLIRTASIVFLLLAFNYVLNWIIIGLPVIGTRAVPSAFVLTDLIGFTLVAQVVDIFASMVGFVLGALLSVVFANGETQIVVALYLGLALDLILAGVGLALLARLFMARRWNTPPQVARRIAWRTAIFTNPAWAIALSVLIGALLN